MPHPHRHTPWLRLIALLAGLTLIAAACGGGSDSGEGDEGTDEATDEATDEGEGPERNPVKGGELVFGVESNMSDISPGMAAQPADRLVALGIYDSLTTYIDGKPEPWLAQTLTSNDALDEWTIELREGVLFHDNTPLNADAVKKHFERLQDPKTACTCKSDADNIVSMDMPDGPEGLTIVLSLKTPDVSFADYLAGASGFIESPKAVADGVNFKNNGVGTGPFTMAENVLGERTVLEAWEKYWYTDENDIQLPYLDKLTVRPISEASQRLAAIDTGAIDMFQTATTDDIPRAEDRGFAVQRVAGSSSTVIFLNNSKPPFDDVKARQALAYAIDKELMNERGYDGLRVPSYSQFAPDSAYFNPDAEQPRHDKEEARKLVEELDGLDFTLSCIDTAEAKTITNLVTAMGEAVGMNIEVESQDQASYVRRIFSKNGDYEAACFRTAQFVDPDSIRTGLTTDDPSNYTFYSNEEVDRLLDEARKTADFEERQERYFRVQEITTEELPLITTLFDLFGNVYDAERVGPPPTAELNSLGALKPGFLYAVG